MQLRPVNAIFYNAKHKFIVIYQQGTLWKLPRMMVNIGAWQRREPYNGETSDLYLHPRQYIADNALAEILPTHNFPLSIAHSRVRAFENWWLVNAHDWVTPEQTIKINNSVSTNLTESTEKSNAQIEPLAKKEVSVQTETSKIEPAKELVENTEKLNTETKPLAKKEVSPQTETSKIEPTKKLVENTEKSNAQTKPLTKKELLLQIETSKNEPIKEYEIIIPDDVEDIFDYLLENWDNL